MKSFISFLAILAIIGVTSGQRKFNQFHSNTFLNRNPSGQVNAGAYRPGSDGSYQADNSGAYNNDDGKYHPDNAGQYVHTADKYNHQDDKYKHQADKFGNNGGNNGGNGGFGQGGQYHGGNSASSAGSSVNAGSGGSGSGSGFGQGGNNNGATGGFIAISPSGAFSGSNAFAGKPTRPNKIPAHRPPPSIAIVSGTGSHHFSGESSGSSTFGAASSFGQGSGHHSGATVGSAAGKYDNANYKILRKIETVEQDGYHYLYETENGILGEEQGKLANVGTDQEAMKAHGFYTYTGPDNVVYTVRYTADENGFVPEGEHLPTPPPIPAAILRSLEYQRSLGKL